ncbi:NAD(P)/FAD-dependent oxidoreductase [Geodermatophilus sp. SYSU D00965]
MDVRTDAEVVGGGGDSRLAHLVLRDRGTGEQETVDACALFLMIGARPHTEWLPPTVERDGDGFIVTGSELSAEAIRALGHRPQALETSVPGVLAAGDVRHGSVKRVASAVGEGGVAIQQVHRLLAT